MGPLPRIRPAHLTTLLELASASRHRPLPDVLAAVAEAVDSVMGFAAATINVYRPEHDDYLAAHVRGSDENREALDGCSSSRANFDRFLTFGTEIAPGVHLVPEESGGWDSFDGTVWYPDEQDLSPACTDADRWRPGDALMATLTASDGTPLGILSVDCPRSGQRPSRSDGELLGIVAEYASVALETYRSRVAEEHHRRALSDLLALTAELRTATTKDQALRQLCSALVRDLGFGSAAVFMGTDLELAATAGVPGPTRIARSATRPLLDGEYALVPRTDLLLDADSAAPDTGAGPLGWHGELAVLTLRGRSGDPIGIVVLDHPTDRLRPDTERRQVLVLFARHASAALEAIERQMQLSYLATHDPLTGARNRRDLRATTHALATDQRGAAAVICDIDHFKSVNDQHGHEFGDRVLEAFGRLLKDHARAGDVVVRLGGEEFCLLLPATDLDGAAALAERIRRSIPAAFRELFPGLTASFGVSSTACGTHTAETLLVAADEALYAAKRDGRNRVVRGSAFPGGSRAAG